MSLAAIKPTGIERTFGEDEIIVSKTDLKGRITYANQVFLRISGYTEKQVVGQPHNLIRHPDMPRCIFKLLWDTLEARREIFAYVMNMACNGDHYWVFAHVTPTFDASGNAVGYHSNRRTATRSSVETISPIYKKLLQEESRFSNKQQGMEASGNLLVSLLQEKGIEYDEFAFAV